MPGFVPHVTCGASSTRRSCELASYSAPSSVRTGALAPSPRRRTPAGRRDTASVVVVGRDQARRARPPRSTCCRPSCAPPSRAPRIAAPGVLDHVALAARDAELADRREHHVLRCEPERQRRRRSRPASSAAAPAAASGSRARARPRTCRSRTRARRTRRASRCGCRRRRSSSPAA